MNDIIKFLKNNFDQHELYEEENEYKSISYESNNLKEISIKQSKGFAVRAIKNKGLTFSSTSNYDFEKFKSNFKELSDYPVDTKINFPKENLFSQPEVKIFSEDEFNIPNDFFINKIDETIKKILKHFPNALCDGEYDLGLGESNLSNSNGLSKSSKELPSAIFICSLTRSIPYLISVTVCSTCNLVFISKK